MPFKIVFMGTPDFSVPALEGLQAAGHEIVLVVTQPDRPKGRGRKVKVSGHWALHQFKRRKLCKRN
jgi:methionyl-tRNA formyltransferase